MIIHRRIALAPYEIEKIKLAVAVVKHFVSPAIELSVLLRNVVYGKRKIRRAVVIEFHYKIFLVKIAASRIYLYDKTRSLFFRL